MKKKQTVVVGVTSGIAAYKILDLITLLKKDANVVVVMTKSASRMISKEEFEEASGNKVYIDLFEENFDYKKVLESRQVDHIRIADMADVVVVAPATANILGKMSYGIADDFLTTMLLATQAQIVIFPSMNVHMWQHPAVVENIAQLKKQGIVVVDPAKGALACGYEGKGRLPEVQEMHKEITQLLNKKTFLQGKKIIVTSGGTNEYIDGVRFIGNRSSGKMGVAIAEACFLQGADVLLIRSKTSVSSRYDIGQIVFETADELLHILKKEIKKYDVLFQAAAVSDFSIDDKHSKKIDSKKNIILKLSPREKIITQIKTWYPKIMLIAFKAVWGGSEKKRIKEAMEKLQESNVDAVVVNDVSKKDRGFWSDENEVIIVKKDTTKKKISLRSKREVAEELVSFLFSL